MAFLELAPLLGVADVQKSIDFYCKVLGFRETGRFEPGGQLAWASLSRGPVEIMLNRMQQAGPLPAGCPPRGAVQFYLYCDDVAALREAVEQAGRNPTPHFVTFYRMEEFEFDDPDGYHFICGQGTDEPPTPEK